MYDRPHRRPGRDAVGSGARRDPPTDAHEGGRAEFMRRHQIEAVTATRDPAAKSLLLRRLPDLVADLRTLRDAYDHLAANGGPAPGADGVTYADLSDRDVWAVLQAVRATLLDGSYKPARDRRVPIPKAGGKTRTLTLPAIADRAVGRALTTVVQPLLDPLFLPTSYGYRPGVGTPTAAAAALTLAREDRWAWATADVAKAFDYVPRNRLLEVVELHLPDPRVCALVETVVGRGGRGIRQGHPLSPLLLNLYLHHHLDVPWARAHPDVPLLRYADDLLLLTRTTTAARDQLAALADRCRRIGLPTKAAADPVRDLRTGGQCEWLGYVFDRRTTGGVTIRPSERAYTTLKLKLDEATSKPGGYARTREVVLGWVDSLGPCKGHVTVMDLTAAVNRAADECGVDGVPAADEVGRRYDKAGRRFRVLLGGTGAGTDGVVREDDHVAATSAPTASPVVMPRGEG